MIASEKELQCVLRAGLGSPKGRSLAAGDVKPHSLMCPGSRGLLSLWLNNLNFLAADAECLSASPCRAFFIPVSVVQDAIKWYYLHVSIKENELKVGATEKCSAQLPSHRNDWE